MTDSASAPQCWLRPIGEIAAGASIPEESLIPCGRHMAKIDFSLAGKLRDRPDGRLVLVTAMSPTPAGAGKTTLSIGLAQSLRLLGKKASACLRQPSLGPLLGMKGGALGSGRAEAGPAEEISLQFNGDDYAVVTSHNLISAAVDNHIHHGNRLSIERVVWPRVSTINDRALRTVLTEGGAGAHSRKDEFQISAASEIMSMLCLCDGLADLREMLSRAVVAWAKDGRAVTVGELGVAGAAAAILKNAVNPTLAQSIEGAPVFVHGGPFGNISIGCSSAISTRMALKLSEFALVEAGFSTELGGEKFLDIMCARSGFFPSAAVVVATLGALRLHGGAKDYAAPDMGALERGLSNLSRHIENMRAFGLPTVVVLNRFRGDTDADVARTLSLVEGLGAKAAAADVRDSGGAGGLDAARAIIDACAGGPPQPRYLYPLDMPIEDKIRTIAVSMYGAGGITLTDEAKRGLEDAERLGLSGLPVCVAKTPRSLSDNPSLIGRPEGFTVKVTGVVPAAGAGYIVARCGNVLLMPGMPEHPRAEGMDIDAFGRVTGI